MARWRRAARVGKQPERGRHLDAAQSVSLSEGAVMTIAISERAPVDPAKLEAFLGHVIGDFGAIVGAAAAAIGDELGLYRAMADGEPATPARLAERTGTDERYVREWLL